MVVAAPPTASNRGPPISDRLPVCTAASVREASVLAWSATKGVAAVAVSVPVTSTTSLVTVTVLPVALARPEASELVVAAGTLSRSPVTVAVWLFHLRSGGGGGAGATRVVVSATGGMAGVTGAWVGLCEPGAAGLTGPSDTASISTCSPPESSPPISRASSTAFACSWATTSAGALGSATRRPR